MLKLEPYRYTAEDMMVHLRNCIGDCNLSRKDTRDDYRNECRRDFLCEKEKYLIEKTIASFENKTEIEE